ncbi:peptidase S58 family protein [candidate division KSB1 bacterium]|nr:P1 family peptidase [candidate division KSB1 bacterium]RQW01263.1 MAG: peptidase S58 family protein [candidate division KSB1 bacterium]
MKTSICDVPGIKVGHFCLQTAQTGCTVILPDKEVVAGVDVRGSAPGTRELELLKPVRLVEKIHAVLLTGGSAFGLDAAGGVQQFLEERGIGFDVDVARVPIVPAAVIFDLAVGDAAVRPDKSMGYQACINATSRPPAEGRVGAGCGATVGKLLGMAFCSSGGIGTASLTLENGLVIGALSVVNSLGEIIDEQCRILAGVQNKDKTGFVPSLNILKNMAAGFTFSASNTTLSVVATNAILSRETATKVAQMAQDGLASSIRPAHTMHDGDIVFALSSEEQDADVTRVGAFAARVVAESIRRAVS